MRLKTMYVKRRPTGIYFEPASVCIHTLVVK